jgi:UDP-glucose 4-epimerase
MVDSRLRRKAWRFSVRVLVTGGAGFIASYVAEACLEASHEVVVINNLVSGNKGNVPEGARSEETRDFIAEFKPEAFFHLGAQMGVAKSLVDPAREHPGRPQPA